MDGVPYGMCVECWRSHHVLPVVDALRKTLHPKIFSRQVNIHAEQGRLLSLNFTSLTFRVLWATNVTFDDASFHNLKFRL